MTPVKLYPSKPEKVYFFGTCLVDLFYPEAGLDGIRLLEREGIEVLFPEDQTCCGQPAYTSGYAREARAVAAAHLDIFPEPWPIVVPSGSCGGMMRRHYPQLFAGSDLEERANEVAGRVHELTEFLVHVCHLKLEDRGAPEKVAMHTSCSARREMGLAETGDSGVALVDVLEDKLGQFMGRANAKLLKDDAKIEEGLRRVARQSTQTEIGKRPEVTVVISRLTE